MAQPIVLTYPLYNDALYASTQDVAAGVPMVLLGSSPYAPLPSGPITVYQMQRGLSISSPDDNSTATFTIVGTSLGGTVITEDMVGLNGNTILSTNQYNTIISITPDVPVTNVRVGNGLGATFEWQIMDTYRPYAQISFQGVIGVGGTISYSVLQTLDKIQNPPTSITGFPIDDSVTTPYTDSVFASIPYPVTGLQLIVNATGTADNAFLTFTILQQGAR